MADPKNRHALPQLLGEMVRVSSDALALPFDMARAHYVCSVRAGLVERSMLASARFEHLLVALERLALGGMARR